MPIELNFEIILILAVLGVTIFLFVTELFRIDFTAIVVMVAQYNCGHVFEESAVPWAQAVDTLKLPHGAAEMQMQSQHSMV